jgi:hypothetical protein
VEPPSFSLYDLARCPEIIARDDQLINSLVCGEIIEAGVPDSEASDVVKKSKALLTVYSFQTALTNKNIMDLVLKYSGRRRPIVSVPFPLGTMIGSVSDRLPHNLFTITRSQVCAWQVIDITNGLSFIGGATHNEKHNQSKPRSDRLLLIQTAPREFLTGVFDPGQLYLTHVSSSIALFYDFMKRRGFTRADGQAEKRAQKFVTRLPVLVYVHQGQFRVSPFASVYALLVPSNFQLVAK